jgi:hypothetical protein
MLPVTHIELGTVQRAGDECTSQPTFRQTCVAVGAVVFERIQLAPNATHDDAVSANGGEDAHVAITQTTHITELDWCSRHRASVEGLPPSR